jgi:hypothetical protein
VDGQILQPLAEDRRLDEDIVDLGSLCRPGQQCDRIGPTQTENNELVHELVNVLGAAEEMPPG